MDCDGAIHRVYHYLDGELTVWKRRAITRHLDDCPPCAEGYGFEIEIRAGHRGLAAPRRPRPTSGTASARRSASNERPGPASGWGRHADGL